jgi:hypothetical protein
MAVPIAPHMAPNASFDMLLWMVGKVTEGKLWWLAAQQTNWLGTDLDGWPRIADVTWR